MTASIGSKSSHALEEPQLESPCSTPSVSNSPSLTNRHPPGLPNETLNCWGNALAQALASSCYSECLSSVLNVSEIQLPQNQNAVLGFLKLVVKIGAGEAIEKGDCDIVWRELRKMLNKAITNNQEHLQNDSNELLMHILRSETYFPSFCQIFSGKYISNKVCNGCNNQWSSTEVQFSTIPFKSYDIPQEMNNFFEPVQSNYDATCSVCKYRSTFTEYNHISESPSCLIIFFHSNVPQNNINIPISLENTRWAKTYRLTAIIFDYSRNTKNANHFDCLCNYNPTWYLYDDEDVVEVNFEFFLHEHLQVARPSVAFYREM
jgi:hypothetical protein